MGSQINLYRMRDGKTPLSARYFNPVWESIDTRMGVLEVSINQLASDLAELQALGIEGIQAVVLPLIEEAQAALSELQEALAAVEHPAAQADLLAYTSHADATAITYDGQGRASTLTETYGAEQRVITLGYDAQDRVGTVQTDWDGVRRVEILGYDNEGRVTSISVTENPL